MAQGNGRTPRGQKTMANSFPVVLSSDQSAVLISAASLPLPSGASTSALQTTGNTSVASIDTKIPALGQALAAASVPVVLTAAQVTTLTPPAAITGFATSALQSTQDTSINSLLKPASTLAAVTTVGAVTTITNALPAGTNLMGKVGIDQTTPGTTNGVQVNAALPTGTNTIGNVNQTLATAGFAKVTDGTNTAAVKAASTAPVATDPAFVTTISPNGNTVIDTVVDATASGNITTQNLVPAGAATAGSAVELSLNGQASATVQVTGTYTGALSLQSTVDGTTWVTHSDIRFLSTASALSPTIASASIGIFTLTFPSAQKVRITALAAVTGTATVTVRASRSSINAALQFISTLATTTSSADATTNAGLNALFNSVGGGTPATTQTFGLLYNGSTWDRARGMSIAITTGDTGAKTATGNGATQTNVGNTGIQIVLAMGAVTGTTPTFVMKVQGSVDGGTNWYDVPGATTASLVATGVWGISLYPGQVVTAGTTTTGTTATASCALPRTWRVVWTIGGTTPSFTITSITYNYLVN